MKQSKKLSYPLRLASNPLLIALISTSLGLLLIPFTGNYDGPATIIWCFFFFSIAFVSLSAYTRKVSAQPTKRITFIWLGALVSTSILIVGALLSSMTLVLAYTNLVVLIGALFGLAAYTLAQRNP